MAASGEPPAATTPTKANCEAPENITRLSTMAWATLSPDPTATAPNAIPNAAGVQPKADGRPKDRRPLNRFGRRTHPAKKSARVVVISSWSYRW